MRNLVPKSNVGQFFFFALTTFISYFILVANTRAFTQGSYTWTAITDGVFTAQSFVVAKLSIENEGGRSLAAGAGATIGGTAGSLFAIWCTKHVYGQ